MPNPKDYMDKNHSYVHGYVRRKHVEPELSPEEREYISKYKARRLILNFAIWLVHIIAIVASFIVPAKIKLPGDWGLFCILVGICLFLILLVRIERLWQNR